MLKHALHWPCALLLTLAAALPAGATPGVTATTIVLGQSAALTGPSAQLGNEMREGALAWFDHINKKGGVNGRKIVLTTLDDAYDAERAVKNTRQLVQQDGVFALFGYVGQATSTASMKSVEKEDVPFFAPLAGGESLHGQFRPNVFNVRAGNVLEMEKIIENLEGMSAKKIAAVYYNDAAGKAIFDAFERTLKKHNLAVLGSATIERNSTEVGAAVAKLRPLQATAVLITPMATIGTHHCTVFPKRETAPNSMVKGTRRSSPATARIAAPMMRPNAARTTAGRPLLGWAATR